MQQAEFDYYVSCGPGPQHTFGVRHDSEAHKILTERGRPQHIHSDTERPVCLEDLRERRRRDARMCDCFDDLCADGCAYIKDLNGIPEAKEGLVFISD